MAENRQVMIDIAIMRLYWQAPDDVKEELRKIYGPEAFGEVDPNRLYMAVLKTLIEEVVSNHGSILYGMMIKDVKYNLRISLESDDPKALKPQEIKDENFWSDVVERARKSIAKWKP